MRKTHTAFLYCILYCNLRLNRPFISSLKLFVLLINDVHVQNGNSTIESEKCVLVHLRKRQFVSILVVACCSIFNICLQNLT